MGSCLSYESRSPRANSPMGNRKKKGPKKDFGSQSSFDYRREERLHRIPCRMFLNGSSEIASLYTQQGKKGPNQDAMIFWENFGSRPDTIFCGVFDGHGPYGHMVAKRVRDSLPLRLSSHLEANNTNSDEVLREVSINSMPTGSFCSEGTTSFGSFDEESGRGSIDVKDNRKHQPEVFQTLKESFLNAFKFMDRELRMYGNIDCFCSGTTAVTLLKQGQDLVIGNVGDSRAVLATRDEHNLLTAVQLTVDLKPSVPAEAKRIRKCKGRVFSLRDEPDVARVWLPHNDSPGLAMARAFGDFCLKDFGLISVPDVSYRRITDKDEFIIMASDGIWDVLPNNEVVKIVDSCPTRSHAARVLVEAAVKAWGLKYPTSKVDDCAVVCLFLNSDKPDSPTTDSKENIPSFEEEDDPKYETIEEGNEEFADASPGYSDDEVVKSGEGGKKWSALEGVLHVNSLVNLPRFKPEKEDEKAPLLKKG